jgi:hypothetical protein
MPSVPIIGETTASWDITVEGKEVVEDGESKDVGNGRGRGGRNGRRA